MSLIYSSDSHFVRRSGTICAILVEGISRDIIVKLFKLMEEVQFLKIILFRALVVLLFSGEEPFVQLGRGHHEEQFCEIILNLDQCFKGFHIKSSI